MPRSQPRFGTICALTSHTMKTRVTTTNEATGMIRMILLLTALIPAASTTHAKPPPHHPKRTKAHVDGIGTDGQGRSFAVLRDVGIVKVGDVVSFPSAHAMVTVRIDKILPSGIVVKYLNTSAISRHIHKPDTRKDETLQHNRRDPFWPVGHIPS